MQRQMSRIAQATCQTFGLGACPTIDDPRLPFACISEIQNLTARAIFGGKGKVDVWAIKPVQEFAGCVAIKQLFDDLYLGFSVRRCSKGGQWHV